MEEKKFGLLLLPEVHRRPGEGDLEEGEVSLVEVFDMNIAVKILVGLMVF